jgi:hypothetical protein
MNCYWEFVFGGCLLVGLPPELKIDPNDILEAIRKAIH